MDILKFAMEKEKKMEEFYRGLAEKTKNHNFSAVFTKMANSEAQHYSVIKNMKETYKHQDVSMILPGPEEIHKLLKTNPEEFKVLISQAAIYKKIIELERESEKFYISIAQNEKDEIKKDLLNRLAAEEKKHAEFVEALLGYSLSSEVDLESAEFYHPRDINFYI